MGALLVSLVAWALTAWGWPQVPPINIFFNPSYQQEPGWTVQAQSWDDWQTGVCDIEVEPAWVEQGSLRSVIAHEVGHCLFYQYGWGFHLRCGCIMYDGVNNPEPTAADKIQLAHVAEVGHPIYLLVPGLAHD